MKRLTLAFVSIVAIILSGCSGIAVNDMVPPVDSAFAKKIGGSIRVGEVQGAKKEIFGGPEMVQNDEFKSALIGTLRRSNLFDSVSADTNGDYELTAQMVAQGQAKGLNYDSVLVVDYRIVGTSTGKEVWRKSINTSHLVTVGQEFSGAARTVKAQEGSVRKNLERFISDLARSGFTSRATTQKSVPQPSTNTNAKKLPTLEDEISEWTKIAKENGATLKVNGETVVQEGKSVESDAALFELAINANTPLEYMSYINQTNYRIDDVEAHFEDHILKTTLIEDKFISWKELDFIPLDSTALKSSIIDPEMTKLQPLAFTTYSEARGSQLIWLSRIHTIERGTKFNDIQFVDQVLGIEFVGWYNHPLEESSANANAVYKVSDGVPDGTMHVLITNAMNHLILPIGSVLINAGSSGEKGKEDGYHDAYAQGGGFGSFSSVNVPKGAIKANFEPYVYTFGLVWKSGSIKIVDDGLLVSAGTEIVRLRDKKDGLE